MTEEANTPSPSMEKSVNWKKRILISVLLLAAIAGAYIWYLTLPEPKTINVNVTPPGIMDLRSENPRPDPIYVNFSESAAELSAINKTVKQGVRLSPEIKGEWRWNSDSQLMFIPAENWAIHTEYTVELDKKSFPSHVLLDDYSPKFATPRFAAELIDVQLHQDPKQPKIKKLVATVRFTHKVDQKDFKERVLLTTRPSDKRVKVKEKDYPFNIEYDETGSEAYITSEPVQIPLKEELLQLTISKKTRSLRGGVNLVDDLSQVTVVPGMFSYFRINSVQPTLVRNKQNEPEQVIIIELSDGITTQVLQKNLEVYELPLDRPAIKGRKIQFGYNWYDPQEIGPRELALSHKLKLEFLPIEHDYSTQHSMKYKADPNRHLYIRMKKGIESVGGYILAKTYDQISQVPEFPREVEIMAKGGLLSLSGDKQLSLVSRGNQAIEIEVGKVLADQVQHLVSQTEGDFQNPYFTNYNFSAENITKRVNLIKTLKPLPPGKSQYTSFDFSSYLNSQASIKNGMFFIKVYSWDPVNKIRTGAEDSRLILVTDVGLLVKNHADGTRKLFAMSIHSGQALANAKVDVIGKNGLSVFSDRTDTRGVLNIPNLNSFDREQYPTAIMAEQQGDIAFIPFNRSDRMLDFSRFSVGGVYEHGASDSLKAYLFSDRGIYRPGDTFNIGMIVKSAKWDKDLTDIPLQVIVTDPRGLTVRTENFNLSSSGFEELNYQTLETSPTGQYQVQLYLVKDRYTRNLLGDTWVKVEEFLPDRMKISASFSQERVLGWVHPKALSAFVTLKNLYGTPATQRRVTTELTLSPSHPRFNKHRDYHFHDPLQTDKSFSETLPETNTDDNGEATVALNLERFEVASYQVSLSIQGFEADGGRSVSTSRSILVSPRDYLIGYKADGSLDYIGKDSERHVDIIAVDPKLEKTAVDGLRIDLLERNYVSVLMKQDNGTYKYQSVLKESLLTSTPLTIANTGNKFKMPTDKPGDYVLIVRDQDKTELNKIPFSVAGEANLARSLEKNAELQIKLNKKDYRAGEEIEVHIKAPYIGSGLLTIERDKVYAHKWFKTSTTSSIQTITLPQGIEGNAYINVSFVRDLASKEIFTSPLSYGVAPFTINRDARKNTITLDAPYLLRPGEDAVIKYKTSQPGKIVVFAVNEGILQVANYKTPQPLEYFFQKRALEVNTIQILDLLLPEYNIVREFAKAGGGAMESEALSKNLNPFKRKRAKPVVFWSGIIDATEEGGEVVYRVPDYFNGSLRIMAVAVSPGAVGAAQRKSVVRGHFVISPNVPNFVAPNDEFTISATIANNVEESGANAKVNLVLKHSEHVEVINNQPQTLEIAEGREKSVTYRVKAKANKLGSANFTFTASIADKQSSASIDLSVRPPVPFITDIKGGYVQDSDTVIKMEREMYPQFRQRQLAVSSVPLGAARSLVHYLDKYPYACTEQLVSRMVPYVALKGRSEFGFDQKQAEDSIFKIIHLLRSRQNSEGAFGFWSANSHVLPIQSVYVLHFLYEANASGYNIPQDMIKLGDEYLKQQAGRDIDNLGDARVRAYALYLLTLKGQVVTRQLNDMYEKMEKFYKDKWDDEISRAYMAAAYKLLHLDKQARKLIRTLNMHQQIKPDYQNFYDKLAHDAQYLYILSRHFPARLKELTGKDIQQVINAINDGYYNSFNSAFTVMALDAYADAAGPVQKMQVTLNALLAEKRQRAVTLPQGLFPEIAVADDTKQFKLESGNDLPVFYQTTEAGFDRIPTTEVVKTGIEVQREYHNAKGKKVEQVKLGEEITVHIKLRSIDDQQHYNVAVVDLLPGGFDVVLDASRQQQGSFVPDYVDIREDRTIIFGTIGKNVSEFIYSIKAGSKGSFIVPPTFAEGMYDRSLRAKGVAGKITVE